MRGRSPTPGRGQRGFTLIELLITLSITTIGLIGLMALHLSIARGNNGASRSAEAGQIGTAALEALRAQRTDAMMQTLTGSPTAVPPATQAMYTVAGRNGLTYRVTRSVTALNGASTSLWRIRVETAWTDDGGTPGTNNTGPLDHVLALEVVRTIEEAL